MCHEFQSLDDLRTKKKVMYGTVFKMVLDELELELNYQMARCTNHRKTQLDCSMMITKILRQCQDHMKTLCDLKAQEYFDDNIFRWLNNQMMDVKEMGLQKFRLWIEADGTAQNVDLGLLEWKREWNKLQRKQLALLEGGEQASMALILCQSLGLLRLDVKERNELGETPLLNAAACGVRLVLVLTSSP
jgi:hypothetical protein